ncbi:unnamed protein product [Leuciscus chuanchicus]
MIQLVELQKCSTEPSAEEWGPSTSQVGDPQPEAPHSMPSAATAAGPAPSLVDKKLEMEMDVLKQQKIVLHLQEESPKDKDVRKKWEVALRREGFTASDSLVLCSQHFKQGDFDRTGQILEKDRATSTSIRAEESLSVASQDSQETATSSPQPQPNNDHGYALPASPTALTTRLNEALARVESLEREKKNSMAREKRAKTTGKSLLGDLREKNLINKVLKEKLEFYSGKTKVAL